MSLLPLLLDNDDLIPGLSEEEKEEHGSNKAKTTVRLCADLGPLTIIVNPLPVKDFNELLKQSMLVPNQEGEDEIKAEKRKLKEIALKVDELLKQSHPWIEEHLAKSKDWQAQETDERVDETLEMIDRLPVMLQRRYLTRLGEALGIPEDDLRARSKQLKKPVITDEKTCLAVIREGKLWFGEDPLINCAPHITRERSRDNGLEAPTVRYDIEGRLPTGERLETLDVPAEELESMRWLSSWGARVWPYISPGKTWLIARAMKELASSNGLKREREYTFSGWTSVDGQHAFLTTSGAIMADGHHADVRVDLGENNLRFYNLPAPPEDPRAAVQTSLNFLEIAPLSITAPLWAVMYTAPLGEFIHLNAVIWVYGGSQTCKSTIAMLALSHFGREFIIARNHEYRAPAEWISTDTNLEGLLFSAKDLPFVIDDYAPQHTTPMDARRIAKVANRVIRTVGNRSARGRSQADLTDRMLRPPRGLVISTAELPMVGQSIEGRMIYVTVNKGEIPISNDGKGPLDKAQTLAGEGVYAQAESAYIRWIAQNREAVRQNIEQDYATADLYARGKFSNDHARLIDYYATLAAGVQSALRFALHCKAISQEQYENKKKDILAALENLLISQSERIAQQSPALRFFDALCDLLMQNRAYLAPRAAPTLGQPAFCPPLGAQLVGWYGYNKTGNMRLYLLTNICVQMVKEYWEKTGESFDMLPDALRRQLAQAGLLIQKDARQFEQSVWIPSVGQTLRAAVVDVEKVADMTGISPWPEKIVTNEVEDDY